jgi:hypothetical protein
MSTYSSNLRVELITTGTQAGVWGNTTNTNLGTILENAIAGYATVAVASANQALTANNGSADEARLAMLRLTTSTGAAFAVYAPPVSKQYIIWNNSGYTATIYNSTVTGNTTAAGTGVAISNGNKVMVWTDGTNFYEVQAQNLTGTLAIANGGTGQTTANAAFNALAPSQASANGKYLKSNGTDTSWDQIDLGTSDITGTLAVANGGTGATSATGTGNVVLASSPTLATPTLTTPTMTNGTSTGLALSTPTFSTYGSIKALFETATVTGSAPSSTTNFDVVTQAVQYYTSNASTNFTLNIRGDGSTTLNSILSTGQSVTCTLLVTNGGTAYYPTTIQVDGSSVTPKWANGVAPAAGNTSSVDIYSFVVVKTASATYTVFASQSKFA